jgi:hypothetical protein
MKRIYLALSLLVLFILACEEGDTIINVPPCKTPSDGWHWTESPIDTINVLATPRSGANKHTVIISPES